MQTPNPERGWVFFRYLPPAMKSKFLLGAVFSMCVMSMGVVLAADNPAKPRPNSGAAVAKKTENADKALAQAVQDAGLQSCKPLSDQVTRYLIGNSKSAGMLLAAPDNANARIATTSIEIENAQSLTYASATYAPYGAAGCGVAYDAVTYWAESCTEVSKRLLNDLKPMGTLGNKLVMLDGGPAMRMYLMPAGAGCVQIKKEVVY